MGTSLKEHLSSEVRRMAGVECISEVMKRAGMRREYQEGGRE